MSDVLEKQQQLQDEAQQVLKKLDLMNVLSTYGVPHLVGSAAIGLLAWKDIDISILGVENEDKFWQIAQELLHNPGTADLGIQDTRKTKLPNMTAGLYIGMRFTLQDIPEPWERLQKKSKAWKLDLWFMKEGDDLAIANTNLIQSKLNDQTRRSILEIKEVLAINPKYRKNIFSMDIYQAVLDEGVKDLEGFKEYLKKTGREL